MLCSWARTTFGHSFVLLGNIYYVQSWRCRLTGPALPIAENRNKRQWKYIHNLKRLLHDTEIRLARNKWENMTALCNVHASRAQISKPAISFQEVSMTSKRSANITLPFCLYNMRHGFQQCFYPNPDQKKVPKN